MAFFRCFVFTDKLGCRYQDGRVYRLILTVRSCTMEVMGFQWVVFSVIVHFKPLIWIDPTILHFVLLYVEDGSGHPSFVSPQHSACLS